MDHSNILLVAAAALLVGWNIGLSVHQNMLDIRVERVNTAGSRISGLCARVDNVDTTVTRQRRSVGPTDPEESTNTQAEARDVEEMSEDGVESERPEPQKVAAMHCYLNESLITSSEYGDASAGGGLVMYDKVFKGWECAQWNKTVLQGLTLDPHTGKLTVKKAGTYIIYVQILFHDQIQDAAFGVHVNDDIMPYIEAGDYLFTGRNGHPNGQQHSNRTGYTRRNTVAVKFLKKNDKVFVRALNNNATVVARNYLTFWGIAKL